MTYVLALAMVVVIVAAQWFFTSRALRSPSHFIGWVTGGYAAKIALLAIGLYVPRALGMDVRVAGNRHDHRDYRVLDGRDDGHDAQAHDERGCAERHSVTLARARRPLLCIEWLSCPGSRHKPMELR